MTRPELTADLTADDPRLVEFHRGIYADAFAAQQEPLDAWQRALRGEAAIELTVRVALQAGRPIAGIAFERYPRCGCGFVTYLVVAPQARRCGLGEALLGDAVAQLHGGGAPVVFGEVDDPRHPQHAGDGASGAWSRLTRFQRWGARVAACRYVQPALGPGLARDRALALIVFGRDPVRPRELPGAVVRGFVDELYAATEGGRPDPETAIPDPVALVQLAP